MKNLSPWIFVCSICILCASCTTLKDNVISSTATVIGLEIAQNPQSQLYQAKLGYNRGELAVVPTDKGVTGSGSRSVANVIMEMRYSGIFSLQDSGIYQRLAVGDIAVSQPGAAFMFAKARDGTIDPSAAEAISRSIMKVPAVDAKAVSGKFPLAKAYAFAEDTVKAQYDAVAKGHGYTDFKAFLAEIETTPEKVVVMTESLAAAGLMP
jgi:hypothetical protein